VLRRTEHVGSTLILEKPFSMAAFRSVIVEAMADHPSPTAAAS
jgi:hypothetical protein